MGGVLSSKSSSTNKKATAQSQITDIDRAVLDLKNTRDKLTKYNAALETSMEKLMAKAKLAKQQNRTQTALGLLRLKKHKQAQVESVQSQLLNVHKMIGSIDSQQQNNQIVLSLKAGKDALAKLHQETTVEHVLALMDDIQEAHELEQEINNVLNNAVPTLSADQEEAVEAELAALMEGTATETTAKPNDLVLPTVPDETLPALPDKQQPVAEHPKKQAAERVAVAG